MNLPPHRYRQLAPRGTSAQVISRVLEIERAIAPSGAKPVYSMGHLAHLSGVRYRFLRQVVERERDPYRVFSIRKRDGQSLRSIAAPSSDLQMVQRWLLDEIFGKLRAAPDSFAYATGSSADQCAGVHLGARWILKMDLYDFFHQTDERDVYHLLRSVGYTELVAFEISRLVTRLPEDVQPWLPDKYQHPPSRRLGSFPYSGAKRLGYLPQGAPTSGAIANLLARGLDTLLANAASRNGLAYTRYADDLTFSAPAAPTRSWADRVVKEISGAISNAGYEANRRKTRVLGPGSRLEVLGILVDGDHLRLPPRTRARVERHLRGLEKFGVDAHMQHCGFRDIAGMRNHISGLIAYCYSVEPERGRTYFARLSTAFPLPSPDTWSSRQHG